jgi:lambda family phage portal protein
MVNHPWLNRLVGRLYPAPPAPAIAPAPAAPSSRPPREPTTLELMSQHPAPMRQLWHDGEKYPGGFGYTELLTADYWTLRTRSTQLFKTNLYARGLVRRLVTNIINTGLSLEATPEGAILGVDEDELAEWAELVENRFHLWESTPALCDYCGGKGFGALQAQAKLTALISGDVLCVLLQDPSTRLPRIRLVDGQRVQTPFGSNVPPLAPGHEVKHGVEVDADGRHVAYWLVSPSSTGQPKIERLAAVGASGRRQAWLVYGTELLLDEVRGEPLLSIILQSLREIDRYRDAVQRKAVINAILAMFIKKEQNNVGSRPMTMGAVVRGKDAVPGPTSGTRRTFNFSEMIPGAVLDELSPGEEPHGFTPNGTDEKFGDFEDAIISAIAWVHEIPPEILKLSFSSNYSASQAAINEFKMFLNVAREWWGGMFCQPIYIDWLISEVLAGRVVAPQLLDAWRDPALFDRLAAWVSADWSGAIKPSVDMNKQATAYTALCEQGFISRDRAARETTGTKYSKNVMKLERENLALERAMMPIKRLEAAGKAAPAPPGGKAAPAGAEPEPADDGDETDQTDLDDPATEETSAALVA